MSIRDLVIQALDLETRVKKAGSADARDLAQAQELVLQYIDELERIEESVTVKPYLLADTVADKVLEYWYGK